MPADPALPQVLYFHAAPSLFDPVVRSLERTGYVVISVSDPTQGVTELRGGRYRLALIDVDLRADAVRALLVELRLQWPDTVGVILTDNWSLDAAADLVSESTCDYVAMPCPPGVLKATIARAMERAALARSLRQGLQELDDANARLEALSTDLQRQVDEATAELERKVRALEEERRKREEMIALVAHDLGNPLTALSGYAQLLKRPGLSEDRRENARESLAVGIAQLTRLVGDLVDRSAAESGRLSTRMQQCDLVELVAQQIEMVRPDAPGRRIDFDSNDGAIWVNGDPQRLAQVVSNLLRNAIKYGGAGPVRVTVRTEADEVQVSVADRGPGIPDHQVEAIFERGVRLGGPGGTGDVRGQGLGLHIAHGIVADHGGRIWVQSTPGGGATFVFAIPRSRERGIGPAA